MFQPPLLQQQLDFENPVQPRKLFIGGLCHSVTNEQIFHYFSKYGQVVDAVVMRDTQTRNSRGFGFVTFSTILEAEIAMNQKTHILGEKQIDLKRSIPRDKPSSTITSSKLSPRLLNFYVKPECKLFLTGIKSDADHSVVTLRNYFASFGVLEQLEITVGGGFGILIFENPQDAKKCLEHNGGCHELNGETIRVTIFEKEK